MLRVNATVDEADDDAVTVEPARTTQAFVVVEKFEERRAEVCREWPNLILPDA